MMPMKQVDGKAMIPEVVQAAIGATAFGKSCRAISEREKESLSRALRMDVDEFRQEFGHQLRETAQELLIITRRDLEKIKPDARAYTLAVLIDKASAMEGRTQLQNSSVNIQVNNYGSSGPSKSDLLNSLGQMTNSIKAEPISEIRVMPVPAQATG